MSVSVSRKRNSALNLFLAMILLLKADAVDALALGGAIGADFPFAHRETKVGLAAEGFYRVDPYELRFHYGATGIETYSVLAAMKYFFTQDIARPYIEAAFGPVVVNTNRKGLAYGIKPEASLGLDLGINRHFSTGAAFRYSAMAYFGNTTSGAFQANHGLSLVGTIALWF